MTEDKKYEIKYAGQIITLFALEMLILLVRIAIPINSTIQGVGIQYEGLVSELIYFAIQSFLVIVLANHLIFKNEYKTMGLQGFKDNTFSLMGNLIYLCIVAGVTLALKYIGGDERTYTIFEAILKVAIVFMSTAFVQEVVYRGCIQRAFVNLTNNRVVAIICSSLLFTVTYLVMGLIGSEFDSKYIDQIFLNSCIAFGIGIYFGTLYNFTNNLWIGIIIHGTYEAIGIVGDTFLLYPFKIVYMLGALAYLVYEIVTYNKHHQEISSSYDEVDISATKDDISGEEIEEEIVVESLNKDNSTNEDDNPESIETIVINDDQEKIEELLHEVEESISEDEEFNIDLSYQLVDASKDIVKQLVEEEKEQPEDKLKVHKEKVDKLGQTRDVSLVDLNKELNSSKSSISLSDNIDLKPEEMSKENNLGEMKISESYMKHLERSLGKLIEIYPQNTELGNQISILAFEGSKFNALVTSGMRQEAMNVPEYLKGDAYAELVMFVSKEFDLSKQGMLEKENNWLLDALRELAIYPRVTASYLGWGHTVGNGEKREPYHSDTRLCGMLIYPPVMQDDMTFYTFKEENKTTYIYDVMPLYEEEMDFILNNSGDIYFSKSKESGVSQVIERNRKNVCKGDALPVV